MLVPSQTNVLAVDDNRVQSYAIEKKLRAAGFLVKSVHCGRDALVEAKRGAYAAVLLDVNLPDISGFDVCAAIRADAGLRQPAIVFHSATHASEMTFRKAQEFGGDAFLTYPIESEALAAVLMGSVTARGGSSHRPMLTCWKEIAHFLGKGVRTVQRWEALGMPVHRPAGDRNIVFADPDELRRWMHDQKPQRSLT
ncbi:MAG TPA: response regulator [Candidatus Koribacter sp.]